MRWMMVPLFLISLWCVYMLGATVFSPRVGLWAAVATALEPKYSLLTVEFRTDNLWTTLWLVTLVVLLTGRLTPKRLLILGLLFGAAFGVSMKTTVLALTVLAAGAGTWALAFQSQRTHVTGKRRWQSYCTSAAAVLGGLAVPGLIVAFFASKGALRALYYGWFLLANVIRTLDDNFAPDTDAWNSYFSRGGQCAARVAKHLVAKRFSLLDTAISIPIDRWLD